MPDPKTIEFIQYHRPDLKSGDYNISVSHNIKIGANVSDSFSAQKSFSVRGDRFNINPSEIVACFPPQDSIGDFSNCLPHLVINKSTLPWERTSGTETDTSPWLAVILLDSTETPQIKIENIQISSMGWALESGETGTDYCQTLLIPKSLLESILPTEPEVNLLTHIRLVDTSNKANALQSGMQEFAVVVGNRLPLKGAANVSYLVSLENYFTTDSGTYYPSDANGLIRLVLLKTWDFTALSEEHTFKQIVSNLNRIPPVLRLPDMATNAQQMVQLGFVPIAHQLRQGDKTVSWYRGPCAPFSPVANTLSLPAGSSDELTIYDTKNGVLNVTYSSAWEIGRLLALQNNSFATALYQWKQTAKRQDILTEEQALISRALGDNSIPGGQTGLPASDALQIIGSWLGELSLLVGLPFSYLVPDEKMLPTESIRFFELDMNWIACLLDGAFSIGRSTSGDLSNDQKLTTLLHQTARQSALNLRSNLTDSSSIQDSTQTISGILLRSEAVSGWPNMEIHAYTIPQADANSLPSGEINILRMDHLSKDVLICIFNGEASQVDILLPSEGVHFGLDETTPFTKELRDPNGDLENNLTLTTIPFKTYPRVLDINTLATDINSLLGATGTFTSAQFGLQMVEGVDKISFLKSQGG
ncbi:hypothetical protein [Leptospira ilyithenensis]|uniref:Uncharacterized protein n=1 Tax=Leptospira ilyithenensis TaxID=2484901 RepID=A0A4R9LS15_9LEPT|nr:hypothetical protein [Leptospira ilyithenensis]TGN14065.1 hypothetical protein EHS11_02810 [Leptospira ilyithenensis]